MNEQMVLDFAVGFDHLRLTLDDREWTVWEIPTHIDARAGTFQGMLDTGLGVVALQELRTLLIRLDHAVGRPAQFQWSPPTDLEMTLTLSVLGHITVNVNFADGHSRLQFSLGADQSFLPLWIAQVTGVLQALGYMTDTM